MSYNLTNELLRDGAPCHWTPSVALTYLILASRYQDETQRAYPGLEGFKRVTNLKNSAIMKNLTQLQNEGWIIKTKRGQTGQRAEYKVLFIESDLHRCQCVTPCGKQGSNSVIESLHPDTRKVPQESATASTELHPKRITKLTNKTKFKINENRFNFVISKIPEEKQFQINGGSNFETLLDEFMNIGVSLEQICNFLGSQKWDNSTAPGGLMETLLRKFLVHMSAERQRNLRETSTSESVQGQVVQAIAEISNKLNISR